MPKANWGISAGDVDDFDRSSQFTPYEGPIPPSGVYRFHMKFIRFIAASGTKFPQLRLGLELVPRNREEKKFAGYFQMAFLTVSERTQGFYVPFLDAIGVSGREFENGTICDEEGNIKKIGRWRFTDDQHVKAQIKDGTDQHGNPRKEFGWFGADTGETMDDQEDDEDSEEFDDDYADTEDDDEWE